MASARTLVLARFTAILLAPVAGLLSPITLRAQTTLYWDINGTTAGSSGGATATGTWAQSANANWSTSSAGTAATATWGAASGGNGIAVFSAGTNATGAYTVTVSGTVTGVAGITFEEGSVTVDGGTLTLANPGTINVATTTATISSYLTGSADLTKTGSGTLVISSASRSDYTGATNINAGTLQLGVSNYAIPNASAVTVASGATLDVNGFGETVGSIAGAGNIMLGSGTLQQSGTASTTFSGVISGTGLLQKAGSGTLTLSGANTYTGATNINAGVLNIQNNTALGTAAGGATVASGAALQTQGGITVTGEALTLDGTGISTDGALRNISGNNTWTGAVTLGSASRINSDAGTLTLSGNIGGNTQNLTVGGAGNTSISGVIGTTTGTLTKDGAGTLTLSGANTYTGATTISTGVLNIQNNTALGTAAGGVTVTAGAALQTQGGITVTGEALTLNGTGVSSDGALRNISGNNTWTGAVTLGSASRINSDAGTLTLSGNIGGAAQNLTVGGAGNTSISGIIGTTTGNLTKDGAGMLTLSGANTLTGVTTISGGILTIGADNNLGTAPGAVTANKITLNGGTLQTSANFTLNSNRGITLGASGGTLDVNSGTTLTYGGIVTGTGSLTKADSGTLVLSGANTYTGATNINAGTLQLGASNVLPSTAVTVSSGATLNLNSFSDTVGSIAGAGNVTLGSGTLTAGADNTSTTFSGGISGSGNLTKTGTGTLTLAGANTHTGATNINAGALRLGANDALSNSTAVTVASGATLNLNNYSDTIGSLAGAGIITLGSGTLTVGANNASTTFSGSFTSGDTGTFAKTGTGALTFGADMNLSSGTLVLNGGTLKLGGFTSTFGSLSVTANSILDFGTSGSSVLNILNSLTVNSGVTLTIQNWANAVDYFYAVNNPGATNLGRIVFTGFTGPDTKWLSYDHEVTPVPEPSTYGALLMSAMLAFAGCRRLRTRRSPDQA